MHVSPVNFKALACVLEIEGHDAASAFRRCGFGSVEQLDDLGPWLPANLLDALMAAVVDLTGDPCFGLVAGRSKALMRYASLMQVTLFASSLRRVAQDIERYAQLFVEVPELRLDEGPDEARLVVEPVIDGGFSGHFRAEMVATSLANAVRFAGGGDDLIAVEFPYPCPPGLAERYVGAVGAIARFEQPRCAVVVRPERLDLPLPTHDPAAYSAARSAADAILATRHAANDLSRRVLRLLASALPAQLSVQQTAARLRLSERSLRRQLAALGHSHATLTQQCLRQAAEQLLCDGACSLKEIAERLGFASVASFHRAFSRWHDTTPTAWRAARRSPSGNLASTGPMRRSALP
jgi:AraC-like DNA-binding protein